MLINDWIHIWMDTYKKPFLKESTLDTLKYCLNHITPVFGNKNLADIKGYEIQSFINGLSAIPNMQDKCKKYLNEILEYAYKNRIIDFNPMLACKFKKHCYENTPPMSMDIRNRFIESIKNKPFELLYLTYLYTGARLSEVVGLNSFVVDRQNKIIYIHGTKTKGSNRVVPLFDKMDKAIDLVSDYKEYYESYKPNYVYLCLSRHLKKIGLTGYCVRSFRSTFSNLCYGLGVREKTIGAWLGHSGKSTTSRFYINNNMLAFSQDEGIKKEIELVNKWL